MATTFYGVNATLKETGTVNTIEPEMQGGKVRCLYDSYTTVGTETTGDLIEMGGLILPAEARIIGWVIDCGALGGSCTLTLGTEADTDEFMAATNLGSAAKKSLANGDGIASSLGFEIASGAGQQVQMLVGAGTLAASIAIKVAILFVAKG
jgi:hypothetical protein